MGDFPSEALRKSDVSDLLDAENDDASQLAPAVQFNNRS